MIGTLAKSQDIHLSDASLRSQFISLFGSGDYTGAFNVLGANPQLDTKKFVEETLNVISDSITYLQDLYYTDVEDVLASELNRLQVAIDNYRNMSTYGGSTQYAVNNFVLYNTQMYLCKAIPPIGTLPTNTTYWELIGLKGEQGASSISNVTMRYDWSGATAYVTRDIVLYNDIFYVALQNGTNQNPATATTYWEIFMPIIKRYIHTEATDTLLTVGDVWFKPL